jgi:hypothetical protein
MGMTAILVQVALLPNYQGVTQVLELFLNDDRVE